MTPAEIRELIERLQAYYDSDPSDIYEKAAAALEQQAALIEAQQREIKGLRERIAVLERCV